MRAERLVYGLQYFPSREININIRHFVMWMNQGDIVSYQEVPFAFHEECEREMRWKGISDRVGLWQKPTTNQRSA
uniref:Uncharacterized protein n=1 Tax=Candidatus Kentrum sp. MB TaxID=2138164 RepID=A0A450XZR7_9GAMM|nr:MAG: hypothetical protein BECKMB1821G_GA0114241_10463 [Candidatus Kentron sp. MB]VFK34765.1 MAG: hypothetical protein BECKMB1821I_GA0114274_108318 [Candidatus Kentron sp. MB]VFK76935.1 MAG: hypothetical protein BECKMB1821H_GA0114242_108418 [Candidatus Kentron sp. MB]